MFGLKDRDIKNIQRALKQFSEIESAVIFGSRAMGNYKSGSDVDIAVSGKKLTGETVVRLSGLLNEELPLPYFFDILDYNKITTAELKSHIDKYGRTLI